MHQVSTGFSHAVAADGTSLSHNEASNRRDRIVVADHHAAIAAWKALTSADCHIDSIDLLARTGKCTAFRICGAGVKGVDVIAIRCRPLRAATEHTVYTDVLPGAEVSKLHYYGGVCDSEKRSWIFVDDAAGENYLPANAEYRALAGHWLAKLHVWGARNAETFSARIRHRGEGYFKRRVFWSAARLHRYRSDDGFFTRLDPDDAQTIDRLCNQCRLAARQWHEIERICKSTPQTVVHGDFAIQNLRIRSENGVPVLLAFDWEDAAWAPPAIDLIQYDRNWASTAAGVDLVAYHSVVKEYWPDVTQDTIGRLASVGRMFWQLTAMRLDVSWLDQEWPQKRLENLRVYSNELASVFTELGWDQ